MTQQSTNLDLLQNCDLKAQKLSGWCLDFIWISDDYFIQMEWNKVHFNFKRENSFFKIQIMWITWSIQIRKPQVRRRTRRRAAVESCGKHHMNLMLRQIHMTKDKPEVQHFFFYQYIQWLNGCEKRELTEVLSSLPMVAAILDYVRSARFTVGIYVFSF